MVSPTLAQLCIRFCVVCNAICGSRVGLASTDFFSDPEFRFLKSVLDSQMKALRGQGIGCKKKQAEPITASEEEQLWDKGLLGDSNPQVLLDTMIWMCGLYFALRSGQEYRSLCPGQIKVVEVPGESPHLVYRKDVSKNNQGGLKHRRIQPKSVVHYANPDSSQCFVRLYRLYCSKCPSNKPENAFYLTARSRPTEECWYSREPVGHNVLGSTVKRLCEKGGISGYKTNHSLRVTAATRLFRSGVDEQIIMNVTGHQSVDGVRAYKRMSEEQYQDVSSVLQVSDPKKPKVESSGGGMAVVPYEAPEKKNIPPVPAKGASMPVVPYEAPEKENIPPVPAKGATCSMHHGLPPVNITGCSAVINYNM